MLLGTLGASLFGNLLTGGKGMMRGGEGIVRADEGSATSRAKGEGAKKPLNLLLPFRSLTNIEINNIILMNLDLMVYILEIVYQKQLKKEHT